MWSLLYVIALIASAVAAFGIVGFIPAAVVIVCWGFILSASTYGQRLRRALVALVIVILLLALSLPGVQNARESSRRGQCANHLFQIGLGLNQYRKQHGDLPAASTTDAEGNPLLSWRVALLPYLERNDIYRRIDQAKSWKDPANKVLATAWISFYMCPSDHSESPLTNYFAVVDPRTIWRRSQAEPPKETKDDPKSTILLIEAYGRDVSWASPVDLTFDEAVKLLTEGPPVGKGHRGRHILFADGRVGFIDAPLTRATADALLTCNGGEPIDQGGIEIVAPRLPYQSNGWAIILFLLLSILPAIRLRAIDEERVSS